MHKLKRLVTYKDNLGPVKCEGGVCPAFFKDEIENYYVQGKIVSKDVKNQVPIGNDEDMVCIPKQLLLDLFSEGGFNV